MNETKSHGYAISLEAAKMLRKEIQAGLKDGRKAHYTKIKQLYDNNPVYWVWIDPLVNCVERNDKP
jgi:hypothetical protein